jgi:hypothetical protein
MSSEDRQPVSRLENESTGKHLEPSNQALSETEFPNDSGHLWRGGRDSKAQLPAVSARKRRGQDP